MTPSSITALRLVISGLALAGLMVCGLNLRGAFQDWHWLRRSGLDGLKSKIARAHIERALSKLLQVLLLGVAGVAGLWLDGPKVSRALLVALISLVLVTFLVLVGALRDLQHRRDMLRRS